MSAWSKPAWPIRAAVHAMVYILAATMLVPFAWMCSTSLKTDAEAIDVQQVALLPAGSVTDWKWGNYLEAWRLAELGDVYLNSLIVAVVVTVLSVLHNALAGFAFAKLRMTAKRSVFIAMLMTMMLPYQVYFLFAYVLCGWLGYVDHLHALIVPFLASAFGIFYMRQSIITVSNGLLDAGRVDGLTNFELFWHVVLPSIKPAVGALAIFTFMASWNNFFWPLIVIDSQDNFTLPLSVAALSSGLYVQSWPVQMAAATLITLPTIVVFIVFQRIFVQGLALTGMKG
ncbi:MAG: carbohydrate ABC transporter permease [Phycisphaerales bacterium]